MKFMNVLRKFGAQVTAGGSALMVSGLALADGTGLATGVTTTIDGAKVDITTIGLAVLAVLVLIVAISWIKRAMGK